MWLVRRAGEQGVVSLAVRASSRGQPSPQRNGGRRGVGVDCERAADAGRGRLEREEDVLGLDGHRLRGDRGGDRGIAVAIAPDPAAEAQEGALRAIVAECPHELRHDAEERFVEDRGERAHLVERLHMRRPQLRGAPQDVHFLDQAAPSVSALGVGDAWIIQTLQLLTDPTDGGHHSPPAGFGRVRREDGMDLERRDELVDPLTAEPGAQLRHGGRDRFRDGLAAVTLADHPRAVVLLGEVGEVEITREGASHHLRTFERPRGHEPFRVALEASILAGADHKGAQPLDVAQQCPPAGIGDDLAQELAEHAYVAPQRRRDLLPRGLSSSRLFRHARSRTRASR